MPTLTTGNVFHSVPSEVKHREMMIDVQKRHLLVLLAQDEDHLIERRFSQDSSLSLTHCVEEIDYFHDVIPPTSITCSHGIVACGIIHGLTEKMIAFFDPDVSRLEWSEMVMMVEQGNGCVHLIGDVSTEDHLKEIVEEHPLTQLKSSLRSHPRATDEDQSEIDQPYRHCRTDTRHQKPSIDIFI